MPWSPRNCGLLAFWVGRARVASASPSTVFKWHGTGYWLHLMPCFKLKTVSFASVLAWYRVGLKARFYWGAGIPFFRAFQSMVFFHGNSRSHAYRYQASKFQVPGQALQDRDGLHVAVTPAGSIAFRYNYSINGRQETISFARYGLGGSPWQRLASC